MKNELYWGNRTFEYGTELMLCEKNPKTENRVFLIKKTYRTTSGETKQTHWIDTREIPMIIEKLAEIYRHVHAQDVPVEHVYPREEQPPKKELEATKEGTKS